MRSKRFPGQEKMPVLRSRIRELRKRTINIEFGLRTDVDLSIGDSGDRVFYSGTSRVAAVGCHLRIVEFFCNVRGVVGM